jgi:hypothetical protein
VLGKIEGAQKVLEQWSNATKMRSWFSQTKLNIAEEAKSDMVAKGEYIVDTSEMTQDG